MIAPSASCSARQGITDENDKGNSINKSKKYLGNASSRNRRNEPAIKSGAKNEEFISAEKFDFTKPVDWLLQTPTEGPMTRYNCYLSDTLP